MEPQSGNGYRIVEASSIHVNAVAAFDSFEEFYEQHYKPWLEHCHHPFTVEKSHRHPDERIKYARVRYSCVHRGAPTYRGKGQRPTQTYLGQNCHAFLSIRYDKAQDKLVVRELSEFHSHEISAELFRNYRQNRQFNAEEIQKAKQLISAVNKATPDMVAATLAEMTGKVVSKKDVYNLQLKFRTGEDKRPNRRHYGVESTAQAPVTLLPEFQEEITIDQEPSSEEIEAPKLKNRKRKTAEDSAMQLLLEHTLAEGNPDKASGMLLGLPVIESDDADPTDVTTVEITSTSSTAIPAVVVCSTRPASPKMTANTAPSFTAAMMTKRPRWQPSVLVNPLATKLNLPKLHEEGSADVQTFGIGDITISSRGAPLGKSLSCIKPGQRIYVKTGSGATAISRAPSTHFEMPKVPTPRKDRSIPAQPSGPANERTVSLHESLITGLVRVAPARLLNVLRQVCRSYNLEVAKALRHREHPAWLMVNAMLSKDSTIEDFLPHLEETLQHLSFEPRFVLTFISAALFRPQFGPCHARINGISAFKELLPKRSVLCEIYGVGIIGSTTAERQLGADNRYEIMQTQECALGGGVAALMLPSSRHITPVCLVLDAKRLRELETSVGVPNYIEQTLGPYRTPLRSLLLFEHGSPSPAAVQKLHNYLLDSHPSGFACSGVEVCQSKVDAAVYTAEQQWGPTLVAIGFLGKDVIASSLYLTDEECSHQLVVQTRLMEWRNRLDQSTFAATEGYQLVHFGFAFYSGHTPQDLDEEEGYSPIVQFSKCFPSVPLLGVQANGQTYGCTMDMADMSLEVKQHARVMLQAKSDHGCAFSIVSVMNVSYRSVAPGQQADRARTA
ncbi:hypothetical protein BV898_08177 [Hypsibius exemplaris]|uniref:ZSWIM3 N-terminal domain-containing protein n=1 Tax=Hypsibius exemplaris TaxID=2072580 RepID=A0A1W0WR94_HYPEX|nr:hypothetical protein BV898_08177 [Hypsibius exemplaris]